jgi:hypothetical protein
MSGPWKTVSGELSDRRLLCFVGKLEAAGYHIQVGRFGDLICLSIPRFDLHLVMLSYLSLVKASGVSMRHRAWLQARGGRHGLASYSAGGCRSD